MRPAYPLLRLAVCLTSLTPLASASAWPAWLPEIDALVVRADGDSTTSAGAFAFAPLSATHPIPPCAMPANASCLPATRTPASASAGPTTAVSTPTGTNTGEATTTGRDLNTAMPPTGTATGTDAEETGTETGSSRPTRTQFAPDSPPGSVNMLTPNGRQQATPLYKIGNFVTLGWNYTSLQGTPTAIDVFASNIQARETWTITQNMPYEASAAVVWDTKEQAVEKPLLTDLYSLVIKDSDMDINAPPEPGYLGTSQNLRFGLYSSQPYVPYSEWTCPGKCSAGSSLLPGHAVGLALTMAAATCLSFTWFVAGL